MAVALEAADRADHCQLAQCSEIPMIFESQDFTSHSGLCVAKILNVTSMKSIWCCQINSYKRDLFSNMHGALNRYYSKFGTRVDEPNVGRFYVARYNNKFERIQVTEMDNDAVKCWLVDLGVQEIFCISNIYNLEPEFEETYAQAFECCLIGLEECYDNAAGVELLKKLEGKDVTVHMADTSCKLSPLPVAMYHPKTSECINEDLQANIAASLAIEVLEMDGIIEDVYLTQANCIGKQFVTIRNEGHKLFLTCKGNLCSKLNAFPPSKSSFSTENYKDNLYFCQYKDDWHRIKIITNPRITIIKIEFIDIGSTALVDQRSVIILDLKTIDKSLCCFPPMAFPVQLDFSQNYTAGFLISGLKTFTNRRLFMKIIKYDLVERTSPVAYVEFLVENGGELISIKDVVN